MLLTTHPGARRRGSALLPLCTLGVVPLFDWWIGWWWWWLILLDSVRGQLAYSGLDDGGEWIDKGIGFK